MSYLSYLFPRVIARYSTKYNRDIRVLEEQGKYKLLSNGSRQSGEYVKKLWQQALCSFGVIPAPGIRTILVLGVAGGDVIHILHAMYPDALITGVDIDAKMIEIGKKYFGLNRISGLTLVVANARDFVKKSRTWDLILCDTHIGASIPSFTGEDKFLKSIKKILSPKGIFIINYLREFEYEKLAEMLLPKLKRHFSEVKDTDVYCNRFFFCV